MRPPKTLSHLGALLVALLCAALATACAAGHDPSNDDASKSDASEHVGVADASPDTAPIADGETSSDATTSPCLVDFPCSPYDRWRCDGLSVHHYETHDCHFTCGPGPCSGARCDATTTEACPEGTHCVPAAPHVEAPCALDDAGVSDGGDSIGG